MKLHKITSFVLAISLSTIGVLSPPPLKAQGASGPGSKNVSVSYQTHVQNVGWQGIVKDGATSGTVGKALRLEAIKINVSGDDDVVVYYNTHVQEIGWGNSDIGYGNMSGTEGRAFRLEAIYIKLLGANAPKYDVYYRVHCQDYGWMGWAKNGEYAGTEGLSKRLEGIEIKVVKKGEAAPGSTARPFVGPPTGVSYQVYVQNKGWMPPVKNGALAGTVGQGLSLENIKISSLNNTSVAGEISYSTQIIYGSDSHQLDYPTYAPGGELDKVIQAWERERAEGSIGKLSAIFISIKGEAKDVYDIYYRVHVAQMGWLDWAKNGEIAGTIGYDYQMEGIEIVVVPKNAPAPGSTARPYVGSYMDFGNP